ncbi:MAG TPA: hypothetical protein VH590_20210, partial [Ktedonobacterales bacterium]
MSESAPESQSPENAASASEDGLHTSEKPVATGVAVISREAAKRPRRKRQWGKWPSRVLLALLFLLSFFLSTVPVGRVLTRGAILLPGLLSVTQPAPLLLAGEPIAHTQT